MAHTNGIESFWAMLKRGYQGTFHQISPEHLDRYVNEFSGGHNIRVEDTAGADGRHGAGHDREAAQVRDLTDPKVAPALDAGSDVF